MKRYLILATVLCLLLTGCVSSANGNVTDGAQSDSPNTAKDTASSAPQETDVPILDSTRKDRAFLTFENSEMRISAELVLFDSENKDALEKVQVDALKKYVSSQTGSELALERQPKDIGRLGEFSVLSIDLNAELTLSDSEIISVVYTGELTDKAAAHPTHLVFSLNLDARTLEQVSFSEKYKVGEEMYGLFASASEAAMTAKWGKEYEKEVGTFADVICKAEDFSAKLADGSIVTYFTENDIVLSFPLEYALGGHIEVAVPHVQLDALKTDLTPLKVLVESGDYSVTYDESADVPDTADYYISAVDSGSLTVSRYLGNFPIRAVSHASLLVADVDSDKQNEVVLNMVTSSEGETLTAIFKKNNGVLEKCAELDPTKLTLKCEYIKGKKAKLSSEDGKYTQEFDISAVFDAEAFDKNGKATGEGAVSIKSIAEIEQENGKVICMAVFTLDSIEAGELQLTLSVKDGEYLLTPTVPKKAS